MIKHIYNKHLMFYNHNRHAVLTVARFTGLTPLDVVRRLNLH